MNVVSRTRLPAHFDLQKERADDVLTSRDRVLIDLVALALKLNRVALTAERAGLVKNVAGRHRLNVAPVVVASHQPAESDLRVVEQKLFPVIAHAFVLDAADHKADDHLLDAFKLAN